MQYNKEYNKIPQSCDNFYKWQSSVIAILTAHSKLSYTLKYLRFT